MAAIPSADAAGVDATKIGEMVGEMRTHVIQSVGVGLDLPTRRTELHQLRRLLTEQEGALNAALAIDLGKPAFEAYGTEIGFTIGEIDETIAHLDDWAAPTKVKLPLQFRPGAARVMPQPLGLVLIIAPWNYPVQLLLSPLVAALAAGNRAVLKPSELAPATAGVLAEMLPRYLDERIVRVVTGGPDATSAVLEQRFDHIFFTGSTKVGRIVQRAAAEHLTPVTLELGGKSPAIVTADADIEVTARRIAWGKFINAGQTCVAPDYVLVHRDAERPLLDALMRTVHRFFGDDAAESVDYGRIVNDRHLDRLVQLLHGGGYESVVTGGNWDTDSRYFAPTVLAGIDADSALMSEEIFGPILPVLAVDRIDDAVAFVNERPHPLALYVFTSDEAAADRIVERTVSGSVAVNHTVLQVGVSGLPFGGVGPSGTGSYHGKAGFDTFSHHRSILRKPTAMDAPVLYPPYRRWKQRLVRRFM